MYQGVSAFPLLHPECFLTWKAQPPMFIRDRSGRACPQRGVRFHNVWSHECLLIALTWAHLELSDPWFREAAHSPSLPHQIFKAAAGQPLTFPLFCVCSWAVGISWGPGVWAEARGCLNNVRGSERATKVACNSCAPFPELCGVEGLPGNGWIQKWSSSPPHSGAIFQPDVASESGFLYRKGAS